MSINHAGTGGTLATGEDKALQQMVCHGHGRRSCGGGRVPQEGHRANLGDGKVIKELRSRDHAWARTPDAVFAVRSPIRSYGMNLRACR